MKVKLRNCTKRKYYIKDIRGNEIELASNREIVSLDLSNRIFIGGVRGYMNVEGGVTLPYGDFLFKEEEIGFNYAQEPGVLNIVHLETALQMAYRGRFDFLVPSAVRKDGERYRIYGVVTAHQFMEDLEKIVLRMKEHWVISSN